MAITSTRLRFVKASSADDLVAFINKLGFKVEIKGGPVLQGKSWVIFFVLPENEGIDMQNIDLTS